MNSFWEKFKFWTKIVLFSLIALYVVVFFLLNRHAHIEPGIDLLFVNKPSPNVLLVLLITAVGSIFGWWLIKLVYRAVTQLRHLRDRSRADRMERDIAEMKLKAEALQTKPPMSPGAPQT